MKAITLKAKRVKQETGLFKGFNKTELYLNELLFATIPASKVQPHTKQKYVRTKKGRFKIEFV
jgi:hypothetical protein